MSHYIYDHLGSPKFYVDDSGNRYRCSDGSYAGRTERDGYNTNHLGNRTSYNSSDGNTYRMDGRRIGHRSNGTFYDQNGNPRYKKY